MFATGLFKVTGLTMQKYHDTEPYDDDVLSRVTDKDKNTFTDGYVSNKGRKVTIHLKKELYNHDTIDYIKRIFYLTGKDLSVFIVPLSEW